MALLNTECGIDECIVFGSLASPYSFLCDMYQNLSAMKHIVLELTYLMKLGYEQSDMNDYLSAMIDMIDLFSSALKFKVYIYRFFWHH